MAQTNYIVPCSPCPACGFEKSYATSGNPRIQRPPEEGDISVCINCGAINQFGPDLRLRAPELDALLEFDEDQADQIIAKSEEFKKRGMVWTRPG